METGLIILIVMIVLLVVILPIIIVIAFATIGSKLQKEGVCYSDAVTDAATHSYSYGCEFQDEEDCAKQHGTHFKTFADCTAYMHKQHPASPPNY